MTAMNRHLLAMLGLLGLLGAAACRDASVPDPDLQREARPPPAQRAFIEPNRIVSRGKRVAGWSPAPFSKLRQVNDGDVQTVWDAGKPTPEQPAWVAIEIGSGPTRVLFTWSAAGSFNYNETDYGSPGAYRVETSADSTDGVNGAWRAVAGADPVTTHGRAHAFDFTGQRWVKLVVTRAPAVSPNGVQIDEIAVYDTSGGAGDTWFFMGDSITAFAFGRPPAPEASFAAQIHARHPPHSPAVHNGGIGGDKSDDGSAHIEEWLARNPDARFWAIAYGTNDAAGNTRDTSRFEKSIQFIIDKVKAAGHVPILAAIPFASDGQHANITRFNEAIEELRRRNSLPRGPDLYAWFAAHPEQLRDGLHPDAKGIEAINRLWAEAVDPLYTRAE